MMEPPTSFNSPLPPPPPAQQTISLLKTLDDYYDDESFDSSSSANDNNAMNAADMVLAEIDNISPSRDKLQENETPAVALLDDIQNTRQDGDSTGISKNESMESIRSKLQEIIVSAEENIPQRNELLTLSSECNSSDPNDIQNEDMIGRDATIADVQTISPRQNCNDEVVDISRTIGHKAAELNMPKSVPQDLKENQYIDLDEKIKQAPNPQFDSSKVVKKKPFLRKGTRREPSAIHSQNKPQNEKEHQSSSSKKDNNSKHLEHLERMQEKQREDLQKRIDRRNRAREDIRKNKQGCNIQVVDQEQVKDRRTKKRADKMVEIDTDTDSAHSDDESSIESESSADICSEGSNKSEVEEEQESYELTPVPKKRSLRELKDKRSPMKKNTKTKDKSSKKETQVSEMEEQWQIIKSMRRRQESTLRAAEKEREEVKAWANSEREKLMKWKENQRAIIQKEKQRAANITMSSQRRKRKEHLEEQAAEAARYNSKQAREEIEKLRNALHKHKIEADAVKSRNRLNEKRWKEMHSSRDEKIDRLQCELESMIAKNEKLREQKSELRKKLELEEAKQKKASEKKSKRQKQKSSNKQEIVTLNIPDDNSPLKNQKVAKNSIEQVKMATIEPDTLDADGIEEMPLDKQIGQGASSVPNHLPASASTENIEGDEKVMIDEDLRGCENETKILSLNRDLLGDLKEDWLQPSLVQKTNISKLAQQEHSQPIASNFPTDKYLNTPLKGKTYNHLDYSEGSGQSYERKTESSQQVDYSSNYKDSYNDMHLKSAQRHNISTFHNGTTKEILSDGTTIVRFTNGDIKTTYANIRTTVYYYAETKTSHTTHSDGRETFEFASGQIEYHYPDGSKEVHFPDGTKETFLGAHEENGRLKHIIYADGVQMVENEIGHKRIINF